jgi:hypothetical protein
MGKESPIDQIKLSPLARQKVQELVALLAEERFEDGGRPPRKTTFSTIEDFGHQAGQTVAQAIDEHLQQRHAEHFQQHAACPTCGATAEATDAAKPRRLLTIDGEIALAEPVRHCPTCERAFFPSTDRAET